MFLPSNPMKRFRLFSSGSLRLQKLGMIVLCYLLVFFFMGYFLLVAWFFVC